MPPSRFRSIEIDFLTERIATWVDLKDVPGDAQRSKAMLKKRNDFIELTCRQFYATFPERDPTVGDRNPLTFTKDLVRDFHETIRQWYRNKTRDTAQLPRSTITQSTKRTSSRNLAMKRFAQGISELARELRVENPQLGKMAAFNQATTRFMEQLKQDDPDAFNKLSTDAAEMRQAADKDFTDLSEEMVAQLLGDFPNKFNDELESHAKALPVHIWAVASFAVPPSQEMKTYTMCTSALRSINTSDQHMTMVTNFKDWMKHHMGGNAARQVLTAEPMVYPDITNNMRPSLPVPVDLNQMPTLQLRALLRTYFNYIARWQGHRSGVPWTIIAKDKGYRFIGQQCLPAGIVNLKKVTEMTRDELLTWYRWILDGQSQRLRPEQIFQFRRLPQHDGEVILEFPDPITKRPAMSTLVWTVEEKLYARRVKKLADDALADPSWKGLPLARLTDVYLPFTSSIKAAMASGCAPEFRAPLIVGALFDLERYGPAHTRNLANNESLIAHLGSHIDDESLKSLLLTRTLEIAALLADHPNHPDYSIPSTIRWAKQSTRMRHEESNTWRGGPEGVRAIVAVYIHIANAFSMYDHCADRLPSSLVKAFDSCHFDRLKTQLVAFGKWLDTSLQDSIAKLKVTFSTRAEAWRQAVVGQYLVRNTRETGDESLLRDTHGVPRSMQRLTQCYDDLQRSDADLTLGPDNREFRKFTRHLRVQTTLEEELSDRDSTSGEEIELPTSNGDTDSEHDGTSQRKLFMETAARVEPEVEHNNLTIIARINEARCDDSLAGREVFKEPASPFTSTTIGNEDNDSKPASKAPTNNSDSGAEEDGDLTNTILTDISPIKLAPVKSVPKHRPRMTMEVVIPSPQKRADSRGNPVKGKVMQPENADSSQDEADLDKSIAARRRRRSVVQDPRVQEFIQSARKGRAEPKR